MEATADRTWSGYSLAERDRRWKAVRGHAAKAGLDCVFVPLGNALDAQYLTDLSGAVVVLPTDERPPIVLTDRGGGNAWVPETRRAWVGGLRGPWADGIADALLDAGMERARIGVVGLKCGRLTHVRFHDGVVNHAAYAHVVQRLPNATFVDATDVVGMSRYVKGDEEIAALRVSTEIAEAGIEELIGQARVGNDAPTVYAAVLQRVLALGSEYESFALHIDPIDQPQGHRFTNPPLGMRLEANDRIYTEVCAAWGSQVAQEDQPIVLGPIPEAYKPVIELQSDAFYAGLEMMKPGTLFGDLIDAINGFGAKRGGGMRTEIVLHGRGYGDDGPLLTPRILGETVRDLPIEKGNAWIWKPTAVSADGKIRFGMGGDVVITDQGGERLFTRPQGMASIA